MQQVRPNGVCNLGPKRQLPASVDAPERTADVDALGTQRLLKAIRLMGKLDTLRD